MYRLFLALLLVALVGCTETDRGPAHPSALLTLDASGVGGLTATTPFSPEAIGEALPEGFELERSRLLTERDTIPVLYAFSGGEIVLEIYPDRTQQRVGRIDAASALVQGPGGTQPGRGWAEASGDDMECRPGRAEFTGHAVCLSPETASVHYVFAHGARTARGELPDRATLRRSILERIVWEP